MKSTSIFKWILITFQIVSMAFCLLALYYGNWWIDKHKNMSGEIAGRLKEFQSAYSSMDSQRKALLLDKTLEYIVSENQAIAEANTNAVLEVHDCIKVVLSLIALGLIVSVTRSTTIGCKRVTH